MLSPAINTLSGRRLPAAPDASKLVSWWHHRQGVTMHGSRVASWRAVQGAATRYVLAPVSNGPTRSSLGMVFSGTLAGPGGSAADEHLRVQTQDFLKGITLVVRAASTDAAGAVNRGMVWAVDYLDTLYTTGIDKAITTNLPRGRQRWNAGIGYVNHSTGTPAAVAMASGVAHVITNRLGNPSTGAAAYYIDTHRAGVFAFGNGSTAEFLPTYREAKIVVGSLYTGNSEPWIGWISDVMVYDTNGLTATERQLTTFLRDLYA
jgi:hypothetical protein